MHSGSSDLLITKLAVPSQHSPSVSRSRLKRLLDAGAEGRLTIVCAPAGYGKTTLLQDWVRTDVAANRRVGWVSLNAYDNDPLRFWSYVLAGLQQACPELDYDLNHIFQGKYAGGDYSELDPLLNSIARVTHPVCLVLDDYHVIENSSVHEGVSYLVQQAPDNLRLILSSRVTPPMPLSRLRSQHQLVEISAQDLSFSLIEAEEFLSSVMELDMDEGSVSSLLDITEGWIAGLQLAAVSLRNTTDFRRFMASFSGGNRRILEYLKEEVLGQLDSDTRDFLLKTSVLSELSAPLCNAVLGRTDSDRMLDFIEKSRLFIERLGDDRDWYRYHALFADALRVVLRQEHSDAIRELCRKACTWLWENGYAENAVPYAIAADELRLAAQIVETCALESVMKFDSVTVIRWIGQFPEELILERPRLGIYYAMASYNLGCLDLIEPKLRSVENALERARLSGDSSCAEPQLRAEVAAIRATLACVLGDCGTGISLAQKAIDELPDRDSVFFGFLNHYSAYAYEAAWKPDAAIQAFERGVEYALRQGFPRECVQSQCEIARIRKWQGRLQEAKQMYQQALAFAIESDLNEEWAICPQTGLAELYLEWGDQARAGSWTQSAIDYISHEDVGILSWVNAITVYCRTMNCLLACGEIEAALTLSKEFESRLSQHSLFSALPLGEALDAQVRLWLAVGDMESARSFLRRAAEHEYGRGTLRAAGRLAIARVHIAERDPERALTILRELEDRARSTHTVELLIQTLCLQAMALGAAGSARKDALQLVEEALELGRKHGYRRIFATQGGEMKTLVEEILTKYSGDIEAQSFAEYARWVLETFKPSERSLSSDALHTENGTSLSLPSGVLSERETQVIKLWMDGRSAKEIAVELAISLNTAKAHLKNIYRKLDVHDRRDSVQRARDLGISSAGQEAR